MIVQHIIVFAITAFAVFFTVRKIVRRRRDRRSGQCSCNCCNCCKKN
ncbi:MAG: FeoB-associated Cys-rich membrane protein [Bacteroidales bacterium]|nr:FeoB-associated Cys-rich membrane protein [Bacteroidales bacterium]